MREIEIATPPELDLQQQRTTDLHSLVNVLNIITLQLGELGMDFPNYHPELSAMEDEVIDLARGFQTEDDLVPLVAQLRGIEARILEQLDAMLAEIDFAEHRSQITAAKENFISIYEILNVRLDEFVFRLEEPDVWIEIEADTLRQQMQDVFSAIEKNANGRYYIHFNLALKHSNDYYIDLRIENDNPDKKIRMPLRLKDVLRDLLANARKYTKPGGKVALALHQSEECIQCVIEDSGCGIPEDEIEKVTEFGYRATNVRQYRTMGGGFGLTKAVWLVLSWGGSFSIASGLDKGTLIRITIPNKHS
jgi:signal transduction histidine kinase